MTTAIWVLGDQLTPNASSLVERAADECIILMIESVACAQAALPQAEAGVSSGRRCVTLPRSFESAATLGLAIGLTDWWIRTSH